MTCPQVQPKLSLYLYGELDFAAEEELEQHLGECALCQRALAREKAWHSTLNSERLDVPLGLLSACRRDLRLAIPSVPVKSQASSSLWNWPDVLRFSATRWSTGLAAASFLLFAGFTAARWTDRNGMPGFGTGDTSRMGLIDASTARVRDIQTGDNHHVRIVFDQIWPREITGRVEDGDVRQLLLAAMKDPTDPGIRVDSVEMLKGQDGADVRDALLYSVRHDSNAAVRLKALEGLRRFSGDQATRDALEFVLQHDDNPGVRSEAIDVLAPANQPVEFSPDLAGTLQQILRSEREDEYVRARSMQLLHQMKASFDVH